MNQARRVAASAVTGLGLIVAGFAAISPQGDADAATLRPAQRIEAAFSLLADVDPSGSPVRTVAIGYQTDSTSHLLIRKPGA
jgi:hypothetical protein